MVHFFLVSKKQFFIFLLTFFFIAAFLSWALSFERNKPKLNFNKIIVVDAGHGGIDPGCHTDSLLEKEITLNIAFKLKEELEKANFQVLMTRTEDRLYLNDRNKDIHYRYRYANQENADLFLSIHVNKFPSSQPAGAQTFYYSEDDKILAAHIQTSLKESDPVNNRSIQWGNFLVLKKTRAPGVIIEVGFLSNPQDRKRITIPEEQQKIARAITRGVINYFRQELFTPEEELENGLETGKISFEGNQVFIPVFTANIQGKETRTILKMNNLDLFAVSDGNSIIEKITFKIINFLSSPPPDLVSPLPRGTKLISCTLKQNTLYLNFNKEITLNHWGGTTAELLTINSLRKTLTQLPEVNDIKILVEGREISLAGHIFPDS